MKTTDPEAKSDDRALVAGLTNKGPWACERLVSQYQKRLLKLAYGITPDREESREVVQDVLVTAMTHIHQFRREASLGGWLRKITLNA